MKEFEVALAVRFRNAEDEAQAEAIARAHIPEGVEPFDEIRLPPGQTDHDVNWQPGYIGFKWKLER